MNRRVLQRDVELSIDTCDKVGGFIGNMFLLTPDRRQNLASLLLECGLSTVHDYSAAQSNFSKDLYAAEKKAQMKRAGIWSVRDPEAEAKERDEASYLEKDDRPVEIKDVYVSDIRGAGVFHIQIVGAG